MIYLKPRCGLCNRIRAISSALALARSVSGGSAKVRVCVVWANDGGMRVPYRELFIPSGAFDLVDFGDGRMAELVSRFNPSNPHYLGHDNDRSREQLLSSLESVRRAPGEDWYIETCYSFSNGREHAWMKPVPPVEAEVARWVSRMGENRIGIHIRRTDNANSIAYSPVRAFVSVLRRELAADPDATFYLASDDERIKRRLRDEFGDRVLVRTGLPGREDDGGVVQGLVDLLLLAQTRKVYGSYWSSFSRTAAQLGGLSFEQVMGTRMGNAFRLAYLTILKKLRDVVRRLRKRLGRCRSSPRSSGSR